MPTPTYSNAVVDGDLVTAAAWPRPPRVDAEVPRRAGDDRSSPNPHLLSHGVADNGGPCMLASKAIGHVRP